jgi:hypothetical protein
MQAAPAIQPHGPKLLHKAIMLSSRAPDAPRRAESFTEIDRWTMKRSALNGPGEEEWARTTSKKAAQS